jgi:hypothetical protein
MGNVNWEMGRAGNYKGFLDGNLNEIHKTSALQLVGLAACDYYTKLLFKPPGPGAVLLGIHFR